MEEIVSLAKRRGFIYQGSEIYGGLAGTWDYGPLGVELKRNIMNRWWQFFVERRDDMYGVDAAILMNRQVWQASGHVATFADPLVEDLVTKKRYRADHLLKDHGEKVDGLSNEQLNALIRDKNIKSPDGNALSDVRSFNMMFETHIGSLAHDHKTQITKRLYEDLAEHFQKTDEDYEIVYDDQAATVKGENTVYLRPETAQGIFTNFKNVVDSFYPDLPFGLAQQGRAFRNEISPRDFIFRSREFEQMEIEYFVDPARWQESFEALLADIHEFLESEIGLTADKIHELEVPAADRAHYSQRTIDIEFDFPIGREELLGLAYRTDFDLGNIQRASGKSMEYRPKNGGAPFVPHVIEPSFGVDRLVMAVLCSAYTQYGDRVFLKLPHNLAPVRYLVSPLLKNKPELAAKAREVYDGLRKRGARVMWDDSGNIGKRYAKADEIGVPECIVVDFTTLEDDTVTVRDRDTTEQTRVKIDELLAKL